MQYGIMCGMLFDMSFGTLLSMFGTWLRFSFKLLRKMVLRVLLRMLLEMLEKMV